MIKQKYSYFKGAHCLLLRDVAWPDGGRGGTDGLTDSGEGWDREGRREERNTLSLTHALSHTRIITHTLSLSLTHTHAHMLWCTIHPLAIRPIGFTLLHAAFSCSALFWPDWWNMHLLCMDCSAIKFSFYNFPPVVHSTICSLATKAACRKKRRRLQLCSFLLLLLLLLQVLVFA